MKKLLFGLFLVAVIANLGFAQTEIPKSPGWFNHNGRWSLGVQGGGNMWVNDYNTQKFTAGGNAFLRYSFSRSFSLGIMGGWDELNSKNATVVGAPVNLTNGYMQNKGFNGDLVAWFHLNAGKPVAPYVYLGVGAMMYKRTITGDVPYPEDKDYTTIHVPVGLGLEFALAKSAAISLELGARVMDHKTDNFKTGTQNFLGTDWYPTGRLGLNLYFGSSDDDDSDGDMLTNGYEKTIGTDPNKADTDGDNLSDYEEVAKYKTNPKVADTDGDGLSDGQEVVTYKTDPLKADTDGDGLKDGEEVSTYKTDPLKSDTDGDGLSDGDEVLKYKTDPLKTDTDGDGLKDNDEVQKYRTNPLKADTDGGTLNDGAEIAKGTNPLDPTDDIPKPVIKVEVGKAIVLEGIVFKSGKSTVEPSSEVNLEAALNTLKDNPDIAVEIHGHTDNVGKASANKKLSLARAEAVRSWLVMKGIDSSRIGVKGFGPERPIADNKTPEGRAQNRRIEFYRTK